MRPAWSRDRRGHRRGDHRSRRRCSEDRRCLHLRRRDGHCRGRDRRRDRCALHRRYRRQHYERSSPGRASCPGSGGYHRDAGHRDAERRDADRRCRRHPNERCRGADRCCPRLPDAGRRGAGHRSRPDGACPGTRRTGCCPGAVRRGGGHRGVPDAGRRDDAVRAWERWNPRACGRRAWGPLRASCREAWERSWGPQRASARRAWGHPPWGQRPWVRQPWGLLRRGARPSSRRAWPHWAWEPWRRASRPPSWSWGSPRTSRASAARRAVRARTRTT